MLGSPFNISATAEASDFKFGAQLGFPKDRHKITPRGKSGCGLGLGELSKMLGFPFNKLPEVFLKCDNSPWNCHNRASK